MRARKIRSRHHRHRRLRSSPRRRLRHYRGIYREARALYDGLRGRIRAGGISMIAREAKVSRSVVKAFVNQGTVPRRQTIAKLEAARARLIQLSPSSYIRRSTCFRNG